MKSFLAGMAFILASTASAKADGAGIIIDYAERALARGYGATCSLSMVPSSTDGYYPCLDFGPYRYVREYQKISAYVVGKDKKPFKIMGGTRSAPRFVIGGPWEQDMPQRMIAFWNDIVEGGAEKAEQARQTTKEREEAEKYVREMMGGETIAGPENGPNGLQPPRQPAPSTTELLHDPRATEPQRLDVDEADINAIMQQGRN